ncbi:MarR family winged helix-turn-helix transcriptional regulator [Micromonospora sp. PTRAS2]|uniref:MarR family winged helix-turn-helix transcriptional regulator n=1 Tax=Micromonospora TaxID=1873 RepID=UPI00098D20F6|nr:MULTISPECIES: MarR family transcriptional regulator [unclassified Micromonospora]MDI5942189.1 MarR family transcriptional regulator [Micromonospora sp. DH15]OON31286.1 hypothetical protein BSA16_11805 [Micromonospora sp. Rc5]
MEHNWLDERESRAWRGFHHLRAALTARLARQLNQECGLTEADYAVLVNVSEAPGQRIRSRDLCRALDWERSRLSHQIARMQARGTVERAPCPDDARGFDVVLTAAGAAAITAAAPIHLAAVRHCFVDLLTPEQLDVLGDIADVVTQHLAAEHGEATGDDDTCPTNR